MAPGTMEHAQIFLWEVECETGLCVGLGFSGSLWGIWRGCTAGNPCTWQELEGKGPQATPLCLPEDLEPNRT